MLYLPKYQTIVRKNTFLVSNNDEHDYDYYNYMKIKNFKVKMTQPKTFAKSIFSLSRVFSGCEALLSP